MRPPRSLTAAERRTLLAFPAAGAELSAPPFAPAAWRQLARRRLVTSCSREVTVTAMGASVRDVYLLTARGARVRAQLVASAAARARR